MTLLRTESFAWLETADLPVAYGAFTKHDVSASVVSTVTIVEGGGRSGGKCIQMEMTSHISFYDVHQVSGIAIPIGISSGLTMLAGFAIKFTQLPGTADCSFALIHNDYVNSDDRAITNLLLRREGAGGTIEAGYSNGGTFTAWAGATGSTVINEDEWYYVELKYKSDNSTGEVTVHINGVEEFSSTGIDTFQWGDGHSISLVLGPNGPNDLTMPIIQYGDVYIADTLGTVNNDLLGNVELQIIVPDGNGNTSDFTGSDANKVDNWLHVNDAGAPDDDVSYVEASTTGNKDLYTYENIPSGTTDIKAVVVRTLARKTSTATSDLKMVTRSNGIEQDSSSLGAGTEYRNLPVVLETDPDTASAWTASGINAAEFGVKVS